MPVLRDRPRDLEKWSLDTGGLFTKTWFLKALVTSKGRFTLCMQYYVDCFFFPENRTVLKIESKKGEETIKTIILISSSNLKFQSIAVKHISHKMQV